MMLAFACSQFPAFTINTHLHYLLVDHKSPHLAIILCFQFVFEGMEEAGSEGLDDLLVQKRKDGWLDVSSVTSNLFHKF
jgi:hypothetical protein